MPFLEVLPLHHLWIYLMRMTSSYNQGTQIDTKRITAKKVPPMSTMVTHEEVFKPKRTTYVNCRELK